MVDILDISTQGKTQSAETASRDTATLVPEEPRPSQEAIAAYEQDRAAYRTAIAAASLCCWTAVPGGLMSS
jgi:hypothetical protein